MRIFIVHILSFALVFAPIQASALSINFWEKLPFMGRSTDGSGDLAKMLRQSGFSDEAISFALNTSRGTVDSSLVNQTSDAIVTASRNSVLQLGAAVKNSDVISGIIKKRNLIDGTLVGSLAVALLITEGLYATYKTQENYEDELDAYVTNFVRVGVITGTTTMAADRLSQKGMGNKLAGLMFATAAVYTLVTGTSQIAIEQLDTITAKNIEDASRELESILAEIEAATLQRQEQKVQLIAEQGVLLEERAELTSSRIPENLIKLRDSTSENLSRHRLQRDAYNVNVKEGSPELDYAQKLRDEGFENVGVNNDGDRTNDARYRDILKPEIDRLIREEEAKLDSLEGQISTMALQTGSASMSDSEQARLVQIDESVSSLARRIDELSQDGPAITALRASYTQANEYLNAIRSQNIESDSNLFEKLSRFANSEEGAKSLINGSYFGLLSIIGGIAVHQAIHIFRGRNYIPRDIPGTITINGVQINSLADKNYVRSLEMQLKSYKNLFYDTNGILSLYDNAKESVLKNFSEAVEYGVRSGHINATQASKAQQTLNSVVSNLQVFKAADEDGFIRSAKLASGTLQPVSELSHSALRKALQAGKKAKLARVFGNTPVLGPVVAGSALTLTLIMFASQARGAHVLMEEGVITQTAYDNYVNNMQVKAKAALISDIGISLADPTGYTIPVTLIAEGAVAKIMKNWMDNNAPHLSQALSEAINPSFIGSETISSEFVDELSKGIPTDTTQLDPIFHNASIAKDVMVDFFRENRPPHVPMMSVPKAVEHADRKSQLWEAQMNAMRKTFYSELKVLLSNPDNFPKFLSIYTLDAKLSLVERLAASDEELSLDENSDFYKVAKYKDYQDQYMPQLFGESPTEALRADEELINAYILSRMGISEVTEI